MPNINLNSALPAAPPGSVNVVFSKDSNHNVSASLSLPALTQLRQVSASADTATAADYVLVLNGVINEILPAAPASGQMLLIFNGSSQSVTVSGNGNSIAAGETVSSTVTLNAGGSTFLQWDNVSSTAVWRQFQSGGGSSSQAEAMPLAGAANELLISTAPGSNYAARLLTASDIPVLAYDASGAAAAAQAASLQISNNLSDLASVMAARHNLGLGSAALNNTGDFDAAGTASAAVSSIPTASASIKGLLSASDWTAFNSKQAALNYVPLNAADNLSDLASASAARTNLGLGTAATYAYTAFDLAGTAAADVAAIPSASATVKGLLTSSDWSTFNAKQAALGYTPLNPANNLSDVASAASSRTNLGLGTSATYAYTAFDAAGTAAASVAAIPTASSTVKGLLSPADWTTFNSKQPALTPGALTETGSSVLTITGGGAAVLAPVTIQVQKASSTTSGYLTSADWNTFSAAAASELTTVSLPLVAAAGNISIPPATANANGYLTSADWSAFNAKQNALTLPLAIAQGGTGQTTAAGALDALGAQPLLAFPLSLAQGGTNATTAQAAAVSLQVLQIASNLSDLASASAARANLGLTSAAVATPSSLTETASDVLTITGGANSLLAPVTIQVIKASASADGYLSKTDWAYFEAAAASVNALSFTAPLVNLNGTVSIPQAGSTVNGFLSSTDWTAFNSKQPALGFTPLNAASNLSDLSSAPAARTNLGLGTAATSSASAFDAAGAAAAAVAAIPAANATTEGLLLAADWVTFNSKQAALGFTPLNPANNLSELASPAAARTNLGLGTAATYAYNAFDPAGAASAAVAAIPTASASTSGLLAAADWSTFNSKQNALTFPLTLAQGGTGSATAPAAAAALGVLQIGNNLSDVASASSARSNLGLTAAAVAAPSSLTETASDVLVITGGSAALLAPVTIQVVKATSSTDGYLSKTDWAYFNAAAGTASSLSFSAPLTDSAGTVSLPAATGSVNGYLTSADWSTFSGKQNALGYTPLNAADNLSDLVSASAARGNLGLTSAATATPASLTEKTSDVLTITGGSAALLSAVTIQVIKASAAADGYLASSDWSIFNSKQNALGYTPLNASSNLSDLASASSARSNLGLTAAAIALPSSLTEATSDVLTITGGNTALLGPVTIQVIKATATADGYLSKADWTTFNSAASSISALSFSAPLVDTNGAVSIPAATASVNGYLTSGDWATFNAKQNALGYIPLNAASSLSDVASVSSARTNLGLGTAALATASSLTETGSSVLTITGGASAVLSAVTVQVTQASGTASGYLSSADWTMFHNSATAFTGVSAPLVLSSGILSMPAATSSADGYLAHADWAAFSSKQAALGYTPLNPANNLSDVSSASQARANLGITTGNVTEATSSVLIITGGTGAVNHALSIQVNQASSSQSGYLSSADWTAFNGKQPLLGYTPLNAASNLSDLASASAARSNLGLTAAATSVPSNLTEATSSVLTITGGTGAVLDAVTIQVSKASGTASGYLSSADWTVFNNAANSGAAVSAASPLSLTSGTMSIQPGNASQNGYIASADWTTFNNKQPALGYTPLNAASNLSDVGSASSARSNLGLTSAAIATPSSLTEVTSSVLSITGGSAALLSAVTIQVKQAGSAASGYLSSADWTAFNAKQAALSVTNDTNVTGSVAGGVLTLGWSGTLAAARLNSSVVQNVASDTNITGSVASQTLTLAWAGSLSIARGGTGQTTAAAAFNALSPLTALGDLLYGGNSGAGARLAGSTSATKAFLIQTGTGSASAAPVWGSISAGDVPVLNQNTTGTAANVTGIVAVANGGTGAATASAARTNLGLGTAATYTASSLTEATSSVLTITGGSAAVLTAVTIQVAQAGSSQSGYLSSSDWTAFHNAANNGAAVAATAPLVLSSGTLSIPAATSSANGYLASADWSTFNAKQPALSVTNDTNVTGSVSGGTLTLGWTGTLAAGRLNSAVVQAVVNDTNVTGSVAAQALTLSWAGQLSIARGGTGQTTASAAFNSLSPLTTLGDLLYGTAAGAGTRLPGNTTTTRMFLAGTGTGSASAAPVWTSLSSSDIPTLNQNTTGTAANVTGIVAVANGGTGASTAAAARTNLGLGTAATYTASSLTETTSAVLTITGGSTAVLGPVTIQVAQASATQNGYLASADWTAFNSKQTALSVTNDTNVTGTLSAGTLTLGWTGTLASGRLNSSVVQSVVSDSNVTGAISSQALTLAWSGQLPVARGGTGQSTALAGFNALSPLTALGDLLYGGTAGTGTRLAGSTSAVKAFLVQTGTGSASAAPAWGAIAAADVPVLNQNTTGTAAGLSSTLVIASGGTEATTAAGARTNLGLTSAATSTPSSLTEVTSSVLTITGGSAALLNAVTIQVAKASGSVSGYLSSADWTTFSTAAAGGVTSVTNDTNVTGSISSNVLTIGWSGTLAAGRLNSNVVQSVVNDTNVTGSIASQALTLAWAGYLSVARGGTGAATAAAARTNLGLGSAATYTASSLTETTSSVLTITGGSAAVLNAVTIQVAQASGTQNGYLASADWTTFNSKQAALSVTSDTNVTGSLSGGVLTLGWTGTLAASRLNAAVVQSVVNDTNITGSVASQALTLAWAGSLAISRGGTGQTTAAAAFNSLSPLITLGDLLYGGAAGAGTRLAGNTTAAKNFLVQTGTGSASAAPVWGTIASTDVSGLTAAATATPSSLTEITSSVLTITGASAALLAPVTIQVSKASSTVSGYLSSADWVTFNSKASGSGLATTVRVVTTTGDTATTSDYTVVVTVPGTEYLPASPVAGQVLYINNPSSGTVTISGNGKNIVVNNVTASTYAMVTGSNTALQYDSTSGVWREVISVQSNLTVGVNGLILSTGLGGVGDATGFMLAANNLSDVSSAATARTNLGLGTAATFASSGFLQPSNNLSDVSSAATARSNLGLGTIATLSASSAWTSFTPTCSYSGGSAPTFTVSECYYFVTGPICYIKLVLLATSGSTAFTYLTASAPTAIAGTYNQTLNLLVGSGTTPASATAPGQAFANPTTQLLVLYPTGITFLGATSCAFSLSGFYRIS